LKPVRIKSYENHIADNDDDEYKGTDDDIDDVSNIDINDEDD